MARSDDSVGRLSAADDSAVRGRRARPLRILIADDRTLLRAAIRESLDRELDLEIVGEAADTDTALVEASRSSPDVVLLDLDLPPSGGIDTMRRLGTWCRARVVVLAEREGDEGREQAIGAGASAYVAPSIGPDELAAVIRAVARHAPRVPADEPRRRARGRPVDPPPDDKGTSALTPREFEVLQRIALGMSNRRIAESLAITEQTVKNHVRSLTQKVGAWDRTSAVVEGIRRGWIQLDDV